MNVDCYILLLQCQNYTGRNDVQYITICVNFLNTDDTMYVFITMLSHLCMILHNVGLVGGSVLSFLTYIYLLNCFITYIIGVGIMISMLDFGGLLPCLPSW